MNQHYTITEKATISVASSNVRHEKNRLYDGLGLISANNSSRLLLDYKAEHPDAYQELLELVFGKAGLNLSLIKIEMGSDVDSSSGTEPAVKRYITEKANVKRGAGYQLAADALTVNPNLRVDLLYWGIPSWVACHEEKEALYASMYQWYKETIDALYDTYGLKVGYITVSQNEKGNDCNWIKYIASSLKAETKERYDYDSILIVVGEGVANWDITDLMVTDPALVNAIDIISSHYTSFTSMNAKNYNLNTVKNFGFQKVAHQ